MDRDHASTGLNGPVGTGLRLDGDGVVARLGGIRYAIEDEVELLDTRGSAGREILHRGHHERVRAVHLDRIEVGGGWEGSLRPALQDDAGVAGSLTRCDGTGVHLDRLEFLRET